MIIKLVIEFLKFDFVFEKIFFSGGTCQKDTAGTSAQLSLAQLGGVFIVLVGGMVGIFVWIMKLK